ncbi:hypothetical protein QBC47DRAFT_328407, partial [Echria macrotheca]
MPSFVRPGDDDTAKMEVDFTQLWERHLETAKRDFVAKRLSSEPHGVEEVGDEWDEKIDSVVDALDELAVSSASRDVCSASSPLWSAPDEYGRYDNYTDTALSSPHESTCSVTHSPLSTTTPKSRRRNNTPNITITISDHDRDLRDWHNGHSNSSSLPPALSKHLLYQNYSSRTVPFPSAEPVTAPPTTAIRTPRTTFPFRGIPATKKPEQVHVLVLSWAKHDRRGDDGQLLSPGLDIETDSVRTCFKRRGYRVQCRVIPEDYPTSAVETILHRFLERSAPGTLLVVYYHGYGNMEGDRMVFSSGFGGSHFYWDDVRDPIITARGDILLVLDCCAAPGAEDAEMLVDPGLATPPADATKQLLGVCSPYGSVGDNFVMKALCRVLDGDENDNDQNLVSVQGLCSQMKGDLRAHGLDPSSVFVTQLGGGQLLDIYLPRFHA